MQEKTHKYVWETYVFSQHQHAVDRRLEAFCIGRFVWTFGAEQALANNSPAGRFHQIDGVVLTKFDTIDTKVCLVTDATVVYTVQF